MPRSQFYAQTHLQGPIQPNIGLDTAARQSVIEILNLLLADEAVLSFNTHRADGLAGGNGTTDLQSLYDSQYQQINEIVLEIAERVKILGGLSLSGSEKTTHSTRLDGKLPVTPGIISLLADQEAFIRFLREDAQKCSELYEDQGTFGLLIGLLQRHEKMAWHLRSNIALEQFDPKK